MSRFTDIYRDATRNDIEDGNILSYISKYGNMIFDSHPSEWKSIIRAVRFFCNCDLSGPVIDIGAGEGAACLLMAALLPRQVIAMEIVDARAERIAQRADRFGLDNLTVRSGNAMEADISDAAGLYLFTPFFDDDADRFIDRAVEQCRSGTRMVGAGVIADRMRRHPGLREAESGTARFTYAEMIIK